MWLAAVAKDDDAGNGDAGYYDKRVSNVSWDQNQNHLSTKEYAQILLLQEQDEGAEGVIF